MTKRFYIAGPMRGRPQFNFPAFAQAAAAVRDLGYEAFSPAERDLDVGFDPSDMDGNEDLAAEGFDLRDALYKDTEYICVEADGIVLLTDWQQSSGARAEAALGLALGLEFYRLGVRPEGYILVPYVPQITATGNVAR